MLCCTTVSQPVEPQINAKRRALMQRLAWDERIAAGTVGKQRRKSVLLPGQAEVVLLDDRSRVPTLA